MKAKHLPALLVVAAATATGVLLGYTAAKIEQYIYPEGGGISPELKEQIKMRLEEAKAALEGHITTLGNAIADRLKVTRDQLIAANARTLDVDLDAQIKELQTLEDVVRNFDPTQSPDTLPPSPSIDNSSTPSGASGGSVNVPPVSTVSTGTSEASAGSQGSSDTDSTANTNPLSPPPPGAAVRQVPSAAPPTDAVLAQNEARAAAAQAQQEAPQEAQDASSSESSTAAPGGATDEASTSATADEAATTGDEGRADSGSGTSPTTSRSSTPRG